jgi:hypothetical protein
MLEEIRCFDAMGPTGALLKEVGCPPLDFHAALYLHSLNGRQRSYTNTRDSRPRDNYVSQDVS